MSLEQHLISAGMYWCMAVGIWTIWKGISNG